MEIEKICTISMSDRFLSDKCNIINFLKKEGYIIEKDKLNTSIINIYRENKDNSTIYGLDVSHKKNNTNITGKHIMVGDNGDCYCPNCRSLLGNINDVKNKFNQPIKIEYEPYYDYFCDKCNAPLLGL